MVSAEVVFLGTGTSEGVPRVSCLTRNPIVCRVCQSSMKRGSKNRRRNTSLAIQFQEPQGDAFNIIVDVGKFFWHSAIEWFPKYGINTIDAVVLTHSHADAAVGLDDLRDWTNNVQNAIPVYLRPQDLDVVARTHFYLVNDGEQTGGGGVSKLEFRTIGDSPFKIGGLTFIPLPVMHGDSYTAYGYRFGDFSLYQWAMKKDVPVLAELKNGLCQDRHSMSRFLLREGFLVVSVPNFSKQESGAFDDGCFYWG